MTFTIVLSFLLTFLVGYTATHYTLTSWGVRPPVSLAAGCLMGVLFGVFATLHVAALLAV